MADNLKLRLEILATGGGATVAQIRQVQEAARAAAGAQVTANQQAGGGAARSATGVAELAFRFNNVIGALQNLRAAALPVYDALISSNEKLNAQLLSSQTNLASSTRIFQGGQEITDPTAKIKATEGQLRQSLKQIEIDTQSLVGVTSAQVNELFQITLTNAASLNNQSKQFPDAIASATALTKGWAASLKVVGVPLNQARQEINSILKGQIDQNSVLAKNLNITNDQVRQWQSQGRLVDELNKRLDVFVAGNALAAKSIEGIGSNITDLIERIGRNAGEPLLEPIISALAEVEKYLKKNEAAITNFLQQVITVGAKSFGTLESFGAIFGVIEKAVADLSPIVLTLFKAFVDGATITQRVLIEGLKPALTTIQVAIDGLVKINDLINYRGDSDALDALEQYAEQTLKLQDAVGATGITLRKLQAIEAQGIPLTAEQTQQKKAATTAAKIQLDAINAEITALKALQANNPAILAQRDNQIKALEAQAKKAQELAGATRLEAKSLEVLGTSQEQYAKRVADVQRQIANEANGQSEDFKKAAQQAVDLAKSGVESKQISVEAARSQLQAILNNTKVDLDTQTAAKKAIDSLIDGRISKVKELIEVGKLQAEEGIAELARIRDDGGLEPVARRKAAQQIVAIRKEQIGAETAAIQAQQAQISALQAEQRLGEQAADQENTALKIAEINKQVEAQQSALENATNTTERDRILADLQKTEADRSKLQAEFDQRERKRLVDFYDDRRALIKAQRDLGLSDQQTYNTQILLNDAAQIDLQLAQQKQAAAQLAAGDVAGQNAILAKVADLQSKRVAIIRQYDEAEIKRSNEISDQRLKVLESFKNAQLISEADFARLRLQNRLEQADEEIKIQQVSLSRLGKNDIEGRNAIEARIYELRSKRIAAFDQLYQAELEQIKNYQAQANSAIQQSEAERATLVQIAANRQLSTIEQTEQAKLDDQRKSLLAQLELAKKQETELAKLANQTRSPESERAYQSEVRAARLATTQATLRLLEQEGQQTQRQRGLAIRAIEDRAAAQNRAADAQLGKIAQVIAAQTRASRAAEAGSEREVFGLDRISKSLELQNSLYQARLNLARAQQAAQNTEGDIEAEKVKSAIELTKQLESGNLSDKERLIIQQRLNDLVGSNTQSVLQLTQRQGELETQAAQRKQAALLFEQEQARIQLTLEQKKNDLANQRAVIEAKIGELKAKQSLLDAQAVLQQQRINNQRTVQGAQGDVEKAKELAPGKDRDRQLADAEAKLSLAKQTAITSESNALQSIDLARQQVDFAKITTQQAQAQQAQQAEINRLQTVTLDIQQRSAKAQAESVESARKYADELARARAEAERLAGILGGSSGSPLPRRAGGGRVNSGQPTIVGEKEQEVFIPGASGVVLNRQQILGNLGLLAKGAGIQVPVGGGQSGGQGAVVQQLQSLQAAIEGRPPAQINPTVTFGRPDSSESDGFFAMLRSIERGTL